MKIRNWDKFQHFKDRRPPWIKLYRDILEDPDWHALDGEMAKHLVMLWLIASENDGNLPDIRKISFRLRIREDKAKQLLNSLSHWLVQDDITLISDRYHDDAPETETETETEKKDIVRENKKSRVEETTDHFEVWYAAYPLHKGRGAALRAYRTAHTKTGWGQLLEGAQAFARQCAGKDPQFIPYPASWLNKERWADEDLQPKPAQEPISNGQTYVKYGTEAGDAWEKHNRYLGKVSPRDSKGGWYYPNEFPGSYTSNPETVSHEKSEAA